MSDFVIHLRGLPFKAKEQDIVDFLEVNPDNILDLEIGRNHEGRPSGEAHVILQSENDLQIALNQHKKTMAGFSRYVEVFDDSKKGYSNSGAGAGGRRDRGRVWTGNSTDRFDGVIKCRGLPFACTPDDIVNFFGDSCEIAPDGVTLAISDRGDCSGEGYVQFMDFDSADAAMHKNKQEINGRYIELFRSSNNERRKCIMKNMETEFRKDGSHAGISGNSGWGRQQQQQQQQQQHQMPMMNNPMMMQGMMGGMTNPMMNAASQGGWGPQSSGGGPMKSNSFGGNRAAPYQMPGINNPMMMQQQQPPIGIPQQQKPAVQISPDPNNPFPHKVVLSNVEPTTQNTQLQEFFKPHKPVAVNNHLNGTCEVAFGDHLQAVAAMDKNGHILGNNTITMVLDSVAPQTGWSTL